MNGWQFVGMVVTCVALGWLIGMIEDWWKDRRG